MGGSIVYISSLQIYLLDLFIELFSRLSRIYIYLNDNYFDEFLKPRNSHANYRVQGKLVIMGKDGRARCVCAVVRGIVCNWASQTFVWFETLFRRRRYRLSRRLSSAQPSGSERPQKRLLDASSDAFPYSFETLRELGCRLFG